MTRNEQLFEAYQGGLSLGRTASQFGLAKSTAWNIVRRVAKRRGTVPRSSPPELTRPRAIARLEQHALDDLARGKTTQRRVARATGLSISTIQRALRRQGGNSPKKTAEELARLRAQVYEDFLRGNQGRPMPVRDVARKHGLNPHTTLGYIARQRKLLQGVAP